jgi:AcrR family transcriptional regulator
MARPRTQGPQTREKILDVALELFVQYGYDKTSLRDIAERLGITKAALYYYFERKEDILMELHLRLHAMGSEVLDELEAVPDGPARIAAFPAMLERLVVTMVGNRQLILLHRRNQSALEALHSDERNRVENEDLQRRLVRILSSEEISLTLRVRVACAIGAITETFFESGDAFGDVEPEELADLVRDVISDLLGSQLAAAAPRL